MIITECCGRRARDHRKSGGNLYCSACGVTVDVYGNPVQFVSEANPDSTKQKGE